MPTPSAVDLEEPPDLAVPMQRPVDLDRCLGGGSDARVPGAPIDAASAPAVGASRQPPCETEVEVEDVRTVERIRRARSEDSAVRRDRVGVNEAAHRDAVDGELGLPTRNPPLVSIGTRRMSEARR